MKAIVLKDISPIIKKGSVLIKKGKFGILEGYSERKTIPTILGNRIVNPPNFYPWEQIKLQKNWYKIVNNEY